MNDMNRYVEEWFSVSYTEFADDEFDIMEEELFRGFDKLTREFDRIFNANLNELEFSESYVGVKSETLGEEIDVIPYSSYPVNLRPNNTRARKTRRNIKPVPVQRHNHLNSHYYNLTDDDNITLPLPRIKKEESDSLEDIIVTDKNIKVVSQLPVNNRREDVKVVAYSDNSVTISHLSPGGKRHYRSSVIPYNIDIETARSTYKNGILEITFNRK
jgi:HSP20 family molecular chaperone IbpA